LGKLLPWWDEAVERARYLTEDGLALADEAQDIWRLPTREEVVQIVGGKGHSAASDLLEWLSDREISLPWPNSVKTSGHEPLVHGIAQVAAGIEDSSNRVDDVLLVSDCGRRVLGIVIRRDDRAAVKAFL
jgi:hypothetical protein